MNPEQKQAYEWAKNQIYTSVAAGYAKTLAGAITELLARAEAVERERDQLREAMKPNCLLCDSMHPDNGNCTEVGGFCTAVPAAHCPLIPRLREQLAATETRAKNAERERDAAIDDLSRRPHHSTCKYGKHCDYVSVITGAPDCYSCNEWEWAGGQKEEL